MELHHIQRPLLSRDGPPPSRASISSRQQRQVFLRHDTADQRYGVKPRTRKDVLQQAFD